MGKIINPHNTEVSQKNDENSVETRNKMNLKTADNEIIIIPPEEITDTWAISSYYPATYGNWSIRRNILYKQVF